ncbi:tetratricopeptide repeat protein [Chitinimonas sp.]|uniref:tetratricopeptide repeat protein n=1 Tax=Chitinimonas sp. TaxID=1934313 RepID=UPI0035B01B70
MLKYLDIARLVGAGIKCTACTGTRCRQSRWHSKHEKLGHQGFQPYRCEDCTNRFFAASSASLERTLINSTAYVMLGIGVLTAADLWLGSNDDPAAGRVELVSTINTEESMARPRDDTEAPNHTSEETPDAKRHPEDPADNVVLLQKAATNGHAGAMVQLGQILSAGKGHPKDARQAAKWMQLAAATGNAEGMFELGRFYRNGMGLPQNSVHAYVWLNRAAAANHLGAMHERDDLVRTMSAEELREAHDRALSEDWGNDGGRRKQ